MNSEDIFDGVTGIRDDLIDKESEAPKKHKRRVRPLWIGAVAAALAVVILAGILLNPGGSPAYAVAEASYPEMARYPSGFDRFSDSAYSEWREDVLAQRRELGDVSDLQEFFTRSSQTFLTGDVGENRAYSPLNVYIALAMLARITGGESREQILDLTGSDSTESLLSRAGDVWNSNYRDDGALTSILASSLWLNEDVSFYRDAVDDLARELYASTYRGEMGSDGFNKALQSWLNEQTGGLLKEQAESIELDSETILALTSTVYFNAKWHSKFSKEATEPGVFHSPGGDTQTEYMFQRSLGTYFWGEHFAAVSQDFETGGRMWFLLPDEGVTPEELLSDGEATEFLFSSDSQKYERENQKYLFVNKTVPKFDVSSQYDLKGGLQELGVTDVFDPWRSDFTPMTDEPVFISKAEHAVRVVIDEDGCTAAAFTVLQGYGAAAPPDGEVDFVLDRPFIFCVTGDSGLPLFVGIVNNPSGN